MSGLRFVTASCVPSLQPHDGTSTFFVLEWPKRDSVTHPWAISYHLSNRGAAKRVLDGFLSGDLKIGRHTPSPCRDFLSGGQQLGEAREPVGDIGLAQHRPERQC